MRDLSGDISPLERGFEGCVTVKGAAWVEGLRDTVSRRLVLQGVIRQASGGCFWSRRLCSGVTHPLPSREGRLEAAFFLMMRDLSVSGSPLERGFKGCVTVRGAAWVEGLRDTVSRGLVLRGIIRQASGDHFDSFAGVQPGPDVAGFVIRVRFPKARMSLQSRCVRRD